MDNVVLLFLILIIIVVSVSRTSNCFN